VRNAPIKRFEDIEAWQRTRLLTRRIYRLTKTNEFSRDHLLRDQIQRPSVFVMANIAEGYGSRTDTLFPKIFRRAKASCGKVRSEIYVALDAGYLPENRHSELCELAEHCSGKIQNFVAYLERNSHT
jgi:four helix bundle protein